MFGCSGGFERNEYRRGGGNKEQSLGICLVVILSIAKTVDTGIDFRKRTMKLEDAESVRAAVNKLPAVEQRKTVGVYA